MQETDIPVHETNKNLDLNGRPDVLEGRTLRLRTPCGSFFLTLNENNGKLYEIRASIGKSGNCVRNLLETIGILLSVLLQSGMDRETIKKVIEKRFDIDCGNKSFQDGIEYHSCVDFMVKMMLEEMAGRGEVEL